ncbi:hypothetical protein TIFTF001_012793 [Ficus carica]|uniref:Uncharacterized protein n=1 Tax=Ficus carica TaxID=3494 RepID=A0AA88A2C9_FICCA|nr:hypothetical protein TIFTF001_012793 [Ficus carica]
MRGWVSVGSRWFTESHGGGSLGSRSDGSRKGSKLCSFWLAPGKGGLRLLLIKAKFPGFMPMKIDIDYGFGIALGRKPTLEA